MLSNSESGHAKNVANLISLLAFLIGYGATYNPPKESIRLSALQDLLIRCKDVLVRVSDALAAYSNAVAAREVAFLPLNKLVTRIVNSLKATGTSEQVDDSAETIARKIKGIRATPKRKAIENEALPVSSIEEVQISASQLSYDNRLENFHRLIRLLISVPLYAPNEADLKIPALETLLNDLSSKNDEVKTAATNLSNTRIERNDLMYKETSGLLDITFDVKTYIKSVFGGDSSQFKQVSKIRFTR